MLIKTICGMVTGGLGGSPIKVAPRLAQAIIRRLPKAANNKTRITITFLNLTLFMRFLYYSDASLSTKIQYLGVSFPS